MEKRKSQRWPRRVEVRLRRHGESTAQIAFTLNISKTGAFIGAVHSLNPGDRVHLEFLADRRSFTAEGQVVRVRRVPLSLRGHDPGGVGIRFIPPEELVVDLLKTSGELARKSARRDEPTAQDTAVRGSGTQGVEKTSPARAAVLEACYPDRSSFLVTYRRDLQLGRLVLATSQEVTVGQEVELRLSVGNQRPLTLELPGRVLQLQPPEQGSKLSTVWLELSGGTKEPLEAFVDRVRELP